MPQNINKYPLLVTEDPVEQTINKYPYLVTGLGGSDGGSSSKTYSIGDGTEDYAIPVDATVVVSLGSHIGTMALPTALADKTIEIINAGGDTILISGAFNASEIPSTKKYSFYSITNDDGATYLWAGIDSGTVAGS